MAMREILAFLGTLLDDTMKNPRLRPSEKARSVELLKRVYMWVKTTSQRAITTKARIEAFNTILKGGPPPAGSGPKQDGPDPQPAGLESGAPEDDADSGVDEEQSDQEDSGDEDIDESAGDDDAAVTDDDYDDDESDESDDDAGGPVSGDVDKLLKDILSAGEEGNYKEAKFKKSVAALKEVLMATHSEIKGLKDEEKKIYDEAGSKAGGEKKQVIEIRQELKAGEQELKELTTKLNGLKKIESALADQIKDLQKDVDEQREMKDTFDAKMAEQVKKRTELEKQKKELIKKAKKGKKK